ncbi:hypothetical protein ONS95_000077 [Cadophora gregata]|uniref:uncharacterized protein n=1 Tax=Cadophora gregata TaxID=51156 RepID=UPI0026DC0111|nr:uncharacterized protein ONS95_000077 [Cadophora gregata]KAK0115653.1 hypothetical protein ONS96_014100 [Cadophora gregata f. sp. sojae]KAK0128093.1 hypothetical protein ONS95_000077 [Cadophora gregata]
MGTASPADRSPTDTSDALVGWVAESRGRGTLTLVSSCIFTIFLCTWVVIHPHVSKSPLLRGLHKFALFLKTIVAPELIAVEALQEWSQAKKMKESCATFTKGDETFTLIHAYFIGMLALKYRTPLGNKVIWPNQYVWLLEQKLIDWKDHASWGLSVEVISDKSNADGTVKLAALTQVSWFLAQCIMRTAHDLPLSQLESMTISYVPLFAVTYFLWWIKPKDIMTPSIVELPVMTLEQMAKFEDMAVSNEFDDDRLGGQNSLWSIWHLTPRVFEKEADDKRKQEGQDKAMQEAERRAKDRAEKTQTIEEQEIATTSDSDEEANIGLVPVEPKEIVVSYWDPDLYRSRIWPIICLMGSSFGALHLISWHGIFPTLVEEWLWRIAAITSIVTLLMFMHFEKVVFRWDGPMSLVSLSTPVLYLVSRIIMTGGVIAAFRASDPRIYDTYLVSNYWIHAFQRWDGNFMYVRLLLHKIGAFGWG